MKKGLIAFLVLMTTIQIVSTAQTLPNTADSSLTDKKVVNAIVELYEGQKAEINILSHQLDSCQEFISNNAEQLNLYSQILAYKDSIIHTNNSTIEKKNRELKGMYELYMTGKKKGAWRTIGWTAGGLAIGLTIPTVYYFIKH